MAAARAASADSRKASPARSRRKTGPTGKRPPTKKREIRYGSETPRVYTKPLRKLTPETSLGFHVIKFADELLRINLYPWQRWLLIHMLELLPDNSLRFRTVVVLVARQNGKSTLSQVLGLWFMYVYGLPLILGTAQDLDTAEEVWEGAVNLVTEEDPETDEPVRPELAAMVRRVSQVNGKKALILTNKTRWKVKAANRRAGRGLSGDVIFLDELREHQSWDAWGSITKTTMARRMALILAMSNAGDSTSIVLRHLRLLAHEALGDPDGIVAAEHEANERDDDEHVDSAPNDDDLEEFEDDAVDLLEADPDTLGIFEWSAHPDRDVRDRDGWAEANPSLNHGDLSERNLASAAREDPEWVFRTECMCQWPGGTLSGPFPAMSWEAGRWTAKDPTDKPPKIVGKVKACVATSHDRRMTAIAYAGYRADGLPQVEIAAMRAGNAWVLDWLTDPKRGGRIEAVTGRKAGAEGQLLKDITADLDDEDIPVELWAGEDLPGWTGLFYDLVKVGDLDEAGNPGGLRHLPQPALDVAAGNAVTKPSGARFIWDDAKSPVDICTLVAATGAVGLLLTAKPKTPPPAPRPVSSAGRSASRTAATAEF